MSSADGLTRRAIMRGLAAAPLVALAGCNFQPLYAARTGSGTVAEALPTVDVEPLTTRAGQELRNNLIFQFTRGGPAPPAAYRLAIALTTNVSKLAVEPRSGRGEAAFVRAEAVYTLKRIETDETVLRATSSANASYDQTEQRFANYRAEIDAENRAMAVLADLIRIRISAALVRKA
jgi:LPS-assembly lipoprotein